MSNTVILSAARTPVGKLGGGLASLQATELGGIAIQDGLRNPFTGKQMFEEATEVGDELEMTRADLDKWALRSHQRWGEAFDSGRLPEEIVPVTISSRKGDTTVQEDEAPRRDTSLE